MLNNFICSLENNILMITINRPEKLNVLTENAINEFIAILNQADQDDEVKAIIVTGNGKGFCAGADLEGDDPFANQEIPIDEFRDWGGRLTLRIYEMKKPMIAAINGPAVGVGITMTLPMDIRIASANAKMGFVFTRRGIVPEACSGWFLPRVVGISKAAEWTLTGRIFPAKEALDGGLISQLVSPEELLPTAVSIASEIVKNTSSISVALTRQLLWKMLGANHPVESHQIESKMIHWLGAQADAKEGVQSFIEKRDPNFTMKASTDMPAFYPWWKTIG
ncbi:crotonase/enoyl-CoA hydratase family protein [Paenibacillus sp. BSR1-1]|uniref:crotonase/enoyl-CoA hydratase family protein n=1 Tax=Paenibacillus sp. BSR1-1 TaxID=3020845 RepID=UPI0025B1194C|nr:crotonase/enoyl-CoA hydratase family protein [Paenibacillus sp. BSR1-1]MDN3014608.1 crotonase/enoyl-CoA hydratase family protein [Paenibacillus sp. BSR1-1]